MAERVFEARISLTPPYGSFGEVDTTAAHDLALERQSPECDEAHEASAP